MSESRRLQEAGEAFAVGMADGLRYQYMSDEQSHKAAMKFGRRVYLLTEEEAETFATLAAGAGLFLGRMKPHLVVLDKAERLAEMARLL